jgi:hypothetical protein
LAHIFIYVSSRSDLQPPQKLFLVCQHRRRQVRPALGPRVIRFKSDPKLIEFEAELVDESVKFDPPLFTVNFDEILLRFLERFFRLPERFPRH